MACKQESVPVEKADQKIQLKGEYLHHGDAAVLIANGEFYAVQLDEQTDALDAQAKKLQSTPFDMVRVIVKGDVKPNPLKEENGEGWDQMIVIDTIIEVRASKAMPVSALKQEDN